MGLGFTGVFDFELVVFLIGLSPRSSDRRSTRSVEAAELDTGAVDIDSHLAAECIDLLNHMAFADAADGWIAGHLTNGVEIHRQQQGFSAHTRCGESRFTAGVAAADDDDFVGFLVGDHFCL